MILKKTLQGILMLGYLGFFSNAGTIRNEKLIAQSHFNKTKIQIYQQDIAFLPDNYNIMLLNSDTDLYIKVLKFKSFYFNKNLFFKESELNNLSSLNTESENTKLYTFRK